jgi:hypothetical protein
VDVDPTTEMEIAAAPLVVIDCAAPSASKLRVNGVGLLAAPPLSGTVLLREMAEVLGLGAIAVVRFWTLIVEARPISAVLTPAD